MFQGKPCVLLMTHSIPGSYGSCNYYPIDSTRKQKFPGVFYEEDSAVFFWEWHLGRFEKLYDFKTPVDSTWQTSYHDFGRDEIYSVTRRVDSIGYVKVNGLRVKTMFLTNSRPEQDEDILIYGLGSIRSIFSSMFIMRGYCDLGGLNGLRCVSHPHFGYYEFPDEKPCDFINVGISKQNNQTNQSKIYPNPTNQSLTIQSDFKSHFKLIDDSGSVVRSGQVNGQAKVDVAELPRGVYFLRLESAGESEVRKVVLQ